MKKLLSLALSLLMLVGLMPALADSPADPFLVPVELPGLPEGRYAHLGGSRILVQTEGDDPLMIYDLDTAETIVVRPREEDLETWLAAYHVACVTEGLNLTSTELDTARSYGVNALYAFVVTSEDIHVVSIGDQYAALFEGYLLNRTTGEIALIPQGLYAGYFTAWDTFIRPNDTLTACLQYDVKGQLLHTSSFELEGYQLGGTLPLKDGVLATLFLTDKENKQTHYQFVLLDREQNIRQVIDAGSHHNQWLDVYAAHLYEGNGRLLLFTKGNAYGTNIKAKENGKLVVTRIPNGPYLDGLLLIDTQAGEVYGLKEELPGILTFFLASSDGSYILLPDPPEQRLRKLDMETGLITEQMSSSELRDAFRTYIEWYESNGLSVSAPIGYLTWDGGEYAVTPWIVFRVAERP